mgnify:CR=1 FL=1
MVAALGGGAAGRVLVSDADRARLADVIGDAYAAGRLNRDEYEERLTATLAARTAAGRSIVVRVVLRGFTPLHDELRMRGVADDLLASLGF